MKRAMILHGMVHWVFDAADYPEPPWPPGPDGNVPVIVDLAGENEGLREGDGWNPLTKRGVPRPFQQWNGEAKCWDLLNPETPMPAVRYDAAKKAWEMVPVEAVMPAPDAPQLIPVFDGETFRWRLDTPEEFERQRAALETKPAKGGQA